ncbi:MAG TPA: aconitate hydratase AcnA [candidate division Zixibacteria bacterium]|nr:aconitate hydratase AcnA [candidate division Zixibacteria bacterium]
MPTWLKYLVFQLPGWIAAAGVATALWHWEILSRELAGAGFLIWFLKDLLLYPRLKVAYEAARDHGSKALVGAKGTVATDLAPEGYVRVRGELWRACAERPIARGAEVEVADARGMTLFVRAAAVRPQGAPERPKASSRRRLRRRFSLLYRGTPATKKGHRKSSRETAMAQRYVDSFGARGTLRVGDRTYEIFRLDALEKAGFENVARLPVSLKVLLENLLRQEDNHHVHRPDIEALASWSPTARPDKEIAFMPARVLMQDLTGVPAVVDLAAMREAMKKLGGDPRKINPLVPVDLVIDHSVQVDYFGTPEAFQKNSEIEFERNVERYAFLRWGQKAFANFRLIPPDTGICHQVNLEYLAPVVFRARANGTVLAYPDTVVGTDSHTPMINGLGVVGWGVGGIEAEAALLGQPIVMLIPEVIGFKLYGRLPEGATATDLVLTVVQMLRKKGVVEKFVEFYGSGLSSLSLADRATIGNMAPEYGATIGYFPIDDETLRYLELTGRDPELIRLVEAYAKEQGMFRTDASPEPMFTDTLELDLGSVVPSLAGPRRPQDRVPLAEAKKSFAEALPTLIRSGGADKSVPVQMDGERFELKHGSVVIAAITSCTNTSNPSVLIGAGLLAKKAVEKGLRQKPWVKTSLAPGSKVVTEYLKESGLLPYLERLGFYLVGYGCTTCIGNSGPLPEPVARAIQEGDLVAVAVLSGNRNFEGRIHASVRANYLASPPLVVAYALAGSLDVDLYHDPLGRDAQGKEVFLRDIWPSPQEIQEVMRKSLRAEMFRKEYGRATEGDERWQKMPVPEGELFAWDDQSTYVRLAPYFEGISRTPAPPRDIIGARILALLGDSVTTDHISPAGAIEKNGPAARYLISHDVLPKDFNQYGARRGNHEVMVRGTFANIRLRNMLAPGTEGGVTLHLPDKKQMSIYDAAMQYQKEGVPLLVVAGKEYGTGSSRDWAAKGPRLLGVKAVIAESFERIHRSNLIGMGILPLQFRPGENLKALGLTGYETFDVTGVAGGLKLRQELTVTAKSESGETRSFTVISRIDTPAELEYYRHGGILEYVLRQLLQN